MFDFPAFQDFNCQNSSIYCQQKADVSSLRANFRLKLKQNTFSTPSLLQKICIDAVCHLSLLSGMNKSILHTSGNNSCSLTQFTQSLHLPCYFQKNPQKTTFFLSMQKRIREETTKFTTQYTSRQRLQRLTHLTKACMKIKYQCFHWKHFR